ncbi:MAG: DUF1937 family protein [Bryobacteraceae bacterium]
MASPYTHIDPAVRRQRFESACRAAAALISRGKTVFSPISHSYGICACGIPHDWQFWKQHDHRYLEVCDEVVVLMLDGWQESVGVQAEIAIARELGKPVTFLSAGTRTEENPGQRGRRAERWTDQLGTNTSCPDGIAIAAGCEAESLQRGRPACRGIAANRSSSSSGIA